MDGRVIIPSNKLRIDSKLKGRLCREKDIVFKMGDNSRTKNKRLLQIEKHKKMVNLQV